MKNQQVMRRRQRIRERKTEQMVLLAGALLSLLTVSAYDYGFRPLLLGCIAVLTALAAAAVCQRVRRKPNRLALFRAALDGAILLMLMPVTVPVSLLIMSCIVTIIIGNFRMRGDSAPFILPVPAGYCFAWIVNRSGVMQFPEKKMILPLLHMDSVKLTEGVSAQWNAQLRFPMNPLDWVRGVRGLPIGSASLFLLVVIGIVFVIRRAVSWRVIAGVILPLILSYWYFTYLQFPMRAVAAVCLTNQLLFSVLFIYGAPSVAPSKVAGVLFGLIMASGYLWMFRVRCMDYAAVWLGIAAGPAAALLRWIMRTERAEKEKEQLQKKNCPQ